MNNKIITMIAVFLLAAFFTGCKDEIVSVEKTGLDDPSFQSISADWIPQYDKISMNTIWQSEGINRKGYNYYFLPVPAYPYNCSARFIPASDYFQSWFGMYTVSDNSPGTYALKSGNIDETAIIKLAVADQKSWLKNFAGLDSPSVYVDGNIEIKKEEILIDTQKGWKISGRIVSNADVGVNNKADVPDIIKIKREYWENIVESYQQISLDVFAYIWYAPENKELNVAYFNGVEFTAKDGKIYRTTEKIFPDLEKMIYQITVYKK